MNLYDKSSLILVPSGVKASKVYSQRPENGSGDFTFSRSTAATRVGPSGYIEKQTQNLLLQSNQFDTTWINSGTTEVGGQSGYDGSSNAWLLTKTATNGRIYQSVSTSGVQTFSIYAKANDSNWISLWTNIGTSYFNLANGTKGSTTASTTIGSEMESVGNGWYRCSFIFNTSILNVRIYPADGDLDTSGTSGSIYIQDAQLEQGLVARDYIETTTSAVYGGITDNIPRLDYTDSSCPSLLLEPQRTNVLVHSEYILSWAFDSVTATANYGTSPEGLQNSTRLLFSGAGQEARLGATPTTGCVASIYVKGISGETIKFGSTGAEEVFTLNGSWQRLEKYNSGSANKITINTYGFATARDIEVWGAQLEQGSYATSYIPTYGSAVTRNGATINTGSSSANEIGQQSGVIYAEFKAPIEGTSSNWLSLSSYSSTVDWIFIGKDYNKMRSYLRANNVVVFSNSDPLLTGDYQKVALRYDNSNSAIFINGVKIAEYPSATYGFAQTLNRVSFGTPYGTAGEKTDWKKVVIFPTALTDEEAIALTTL